MGIYRLETTWRLEAPPQDVWNALYDVERYVDWWPGMRAEELAPGGADGNGRRLRMRTRSALPYTLRYELVGRPSPRPHDLVVDSLGDLEGTGRWELQEEDGEVTRAVYTWQVKSTKPWMEVLAPFVRPAFIWNHHVVMRSGGEGLARYLGVQLVDQHHWPPVRPLDWAPLAGLVAGAVAAWQVARRRR